MKITKHLKTKLLYLTVQVIILCQVSLGATFSDLSKEECVQGALLGLLEKSKPENAYRGIIYDHPNEKNIEVVS